MTARIHLNNVGTSFRAAVEDGNEDAVPLEVDSFRRIIFEKPDRSIVIKEADIVSAPGGTMEYISEEGFLDQSGVWRVQGFLAQNGGEWYGDIERFRVMPNLSVVEVS